MSGFQLNLGVTSWGRVLRALHYVARPAFRDEIESRILAGAAEPRGVLGGGLRRSYGDSGLNADGHLIDMTALDRLITFDAGTGRLTAEAGISLKEILSFAIPRGFFLPVTPGTRNVTLAGAIANDVHGKNHHGAGTFGRFVRELTLLRSDGSIRALSPDDETGLFAATIGGLGLTGIIATAQIELIPISSAMMDAQTVPFGNLDEFFAVATESERSFDYTVAWVDCMAKGAALGRGLFSRGRHAAEGPLEVREPGSDRNLPVDLPGFALNRLSIGAFNALYYRNGRRHTDIASVSYLPFFYPLDAIGNWNRLYGQAGMYQYQSVVPPAVARDATAEMLGQIAKAGEGSFLAVLKTFGNLPSPGLLSFPMEGTTLALDFPNRGTETLALLARLDSVVKEARGRLYPAKDGRLPPEMFVAGYPGLDRFRSFVDPGFSSSFWRRINA
jgi:L-gulonolactone oxidase